MLPTAPLTPRTELTTKKAFIVTHDPWASKVKQDAQREELEMMTSRQLLHSRREKHREELLSQMEQRKRQQEQEKLQKVTEAEQAKAAAEDFYSARDAHRQEARAKNASIAALRLEQLRQLEERRLADQQAVEREAALLREEAIRLMEEEKTRLRAKRRAQEEAAKNAQQTNERMRRDKLQAKAIATQDEIREVEAYAKLMEEEERRRVEQLTRHKPRQPVKLYASADKFEAPKYQRYFASVDRAAEEKRRVEEAEHRERERKAKALADECTADIQQRMQRKQALERQRRLEGAQERCVLEADAEDWNESLSTRRSRKQQEQQRHARELELQMIASRQRELLEATRGLQKM